MLRGPGRQQHGHHAGGDQRDAGAYQRSDLKAVEECVVDRIADADDVTGGQFDHRVRPAIECCIV